MDLEEISAYCHEITKQYLAIPKEQSRIIAETQESIRITKKYIMEEIFSKWNPFNGEISFSYNGGKDCQVLLLIYLSCIWEHYDLGKCTLQDERFPLQKLPTVYIASEETFSTLEDFIVMTTERYNLSICKCKLDKTKNISMANSFEIFLEEHPVTKAVLLGVRHSDPFGNTLKAIQKTDLNWPEFMRLQPLLHWKLAHIWSFLLYSNESICGLYGIGFTSIGGVSETVPNPYLLKGECSASNSTFQWEIKNSYGSENNKNEHGKDVNITVVSEKDLAVLNQVGTQHEPGWFMIDDQLERAGRIKKSS